MNPGRLHDMVLCLDMRPYYHDADGQPHVISRSREKSVLACDGDGCSCTQDPKQDLSSQGSHEMNC